jgi:SOS-response transcriptional repressor LexA
MNERRARTTKKQRELLTFIDNFITGNGFGPSYREIMRGMGYKSVATVALHVDNLIAKGYLSKKDNSARSLEVVGSPSGEIATNKVKPAQEKWLVKLIGQKFEVAEAASPISQVHIDELYVLVGALSVLGFDSAANSFKDRLADLKKKV